MQIPARSPLLMILIDVDGVAADFCGCIDTYLQEAHGRPPLTWRHHDLERNLTDPVNSLPKSVVTDTMLYVKWGDACSDMKPYEGAVDAVHDAIASGFGVAFVTVGFKDSPCWQHDRIKWLRKHFDDRAEILIVTSGVTKRLVAGAALIEDNPNTLQAWARKHPGRTFLVDQPYNQAGLFEGTRVGSLASALRTCRASL